jgi:purine catabolism regulator
VLLESTAHRLLAYDTAAIELETVFDNWERNSRRVMTTERVSFDATTGWLTGRVGARGHDWGRLILLTDADAVPENQPLLERAVSALAIHQLLATNAEPADRQAQRDLLADLRSGGASPEDLSLRMRALGIAVRGRRFLGVVARSGAPGPATPAQHRARHARMVEALEQAIGVARITGITGDLGASGVASVLSIPDDREESDVLDRVAAALHVIASEVVIGVGLGTAEVEGIARSLTEAEQAVGAGGQTGSTSSYFRLSDVRMRGFLYSMREDGRLQKFVEQEIGALVAFDASQDSRLLEALRIYLWCGRNKSAAAEAAFMSRPAFYQRLLRIERILGADLDSVDDCLSLHVALVAHEVLHS